MTDIPGSTDTGVTAAEFMIDTSPHAIDHGNGITQVFDEAGNEHWYRNGVRHRDGDKPAIVLNDGSLFWYRDGLVHRSGDKPAVIWYNGTLYWYRNGELHRDGDLPAIVQADGSEYWYRDGVRHRDGDKPAVVYSTGGEEYWRDGVEFHRLELPLTEAVPNPADYNDHPRK